uniref:T cell receptor beta variable 14 n=1 Tax=Macaca fascicularis TaxID=9541 RepID=A0A7N9D4S7_MACFA
MIYLGLAMVSRLLSLVSLCLLGAKHTEAGVTQFPSHRVIEKGQAVTLRCDPISGHDYLYWYRRVMGKEIKFLIYFLRASMQDESGMPNKRFSAERTGGTYSTLKVQPAELEDSGVYFCASSQDTVLHSHVLAVQNHSLLLSTHSRPKGRLSLCLLPQGRGDKEPELTHEIQEYSKKIWMKILVVWGISEVL